MLCRFLIGFGGFVDREVLARIEQFDRESEAHINAMFYEERKVLDKKISDFRKVRGD